jgi:hypothetical protein
MLIMCAFSPLKYLKQDKGSKFFQTHTNFRVGVPIQVGNFDFVAPLKRVGRKTHFVPQ